MNTSTWLIVSLLSAGVTATAHAQSLLVTPSSVTVRGTTVSGSITLVNDPRGGNLPRGGGCFVFQSARPKTCDAATDCTRFRINVEHEASPLPGRLVIQGVETLIGYCHAHPMSVFSPPSHDRCWNKMHAAETLDGVAMECVKSPNLSVGVPVPIPATSIPAGATSVRILACTNLRAPFKDPHEEVAEAEKQEKPPCAHVKPEQGTDIRYVWGPATTLPHIAVPRVPEIEKIWPPDFDGPIELNWSPATRHRTSD